MAAKHTHSSKQQEKPLTELEKRALICRGFINILNGVKDDPRQADAIAHYQKQLEQLEQQIADEKAGRAPLPPPIVIGLKTATITAHVPQQETNNG